MSEIKKKLRSWESYYKGFGLDKYHRHIKAWKGLCHRIGQFTTKGGKILELGFGSGMMSVYLSKMGYRCMGIDSTENNVIQANQLMWKVKALCIFEHGDLFKVDFPDDMFHMVFSQGLLEHFSDAKIKQILKKYFKYSKKHCFSVPLDKFGHQSRGDERLLSEDHWRGLVADYKIIHWSTFADNKQLCCILESK